MEKKELRVIAVKKFKSCDEMYKIVDFLNKMLKDKRIILGLTKDTQKETMDITIYET